VRSTSSSRDCSRARPGAAGPTLTTLPLPDGELTRPPACAAIPRWGRSPPPRAPRDGTPCGRDSGSRRAAP
jgi:hypothetical protein